MPGTAFTTPLDGLLAGLRLGLVHARGGPMQPASGIGDPEADARTLSRVTDWNRVAALARRHRVTGLLLRGMRTRADLLAATGIETTLEERCGRAARRGLRQLGGLKHASDLLAAHGIPCLVLKGLPLSQQLYGHPLVREAVDIDLLVSPRAFQAAERVLLEGGWEQFEPSYRKTPARDRWYARFRADHRLAGPGGTLELHWRLSRNPHFLDSEIRFESLYANSVPVAVGSATFRTLGEEDRLLYLGVHGARHWWGRLSWLCDLAVILASTEPERLAAAARRCRQGGLDSVLGSTLLLCREAFHVEIPKDAAPLPDRGRRAAWIARLSRRTWDDEVPGSRWREGVDWVGQKVIGSIAKPNARAILHEILNVTVHPRDWEKVDLPDRLFFLYFPLHPLLWLTRRRRQAGAAAARRDPGAG